jgi:CheY-like chemotaxis protein
MNRVDDQNSTILIVEDVAETRDGIEKLLTADGYRVALARDESEAIASARLRRPDLILLSLANQPPEIIAIACRIREKAGMGEEVPIVVFCFEGIAQGDEVEVDGHVYITRPDNFNQLRRLLARLLQEISEPLDVVELQPLQK